MKNDLYDYSSFPDDRLEATLKGWNGLGGYHGLLLKFCGNLLIGRSVLDVGCGLCHLYEVLKGKIDVYVGLDNNFRILRMARERYPQLDIRFGDVYNIPEAGVFDTVYAIGLYRMEPESDRGIKEMLKHTRICLVLTYRAKNIGVTPKILEINNILCETYKHDVDPQLEIVRLVKTEHISSIRRGTLKWNNCSEKRGETFQT